MACRACGRVKINHLEPMMQAENRRLTHALGRWVGAMQRHALAVVVLAALLSAGLLHYTSRNLSVDTNNANMLSPALPWRKAERAMDRWFPQMSHTMVVVIDGDTPELADDAMRRLLGKLRSRPDLYPGIFAPEAEPFFRRNGLLYQSDKELLQTADQLQQAQPFLGTLAQDPTVHGLFVLLDRATTHATAQGFDLAPALGKIADGIRATGAGKFYQLSWQELMSSGGAMPDATRRFIDISPHLDYSSLLPAQAPMDTLRQMFGQLQLDAAHGVRARVTGAVALEHEELLTVVHGMGLALCAALLMAIVLLYLALRSVRLMLAVVVTLVFGLLCTAAFAAAAIGHLNMISIAFGVLYVGLGLDYGLYLCMQYRELLGQGVAALEAMPRAARDVGGFMLVCAMTTSLGFLAFIPTDFTGISELGIISGAGMFISLVLSLSLLPALVRLLPPDAAKVQLQPADKGILGRVLSWPYTYARQIWVGAGLLALGSLLLIPKAQFDYDPIDLRDPASESVSTFRDLLKDPNIPTLTLSVLTPDPVAAQALSKRLSALPDVRRAMSLLNFIPQDQSQKLSDIGDLAMTLGPGITLPVQARTAASDTADFEAMTQLRQDLPAFIGQSRGATAVAAGQLLQSLQEFSARWKTLSSPQQHELMQRLNAALIGAMPAHLDDLRLALQAGPVTERDLPPQLVSRWRTGDGQYRVEIWPREILDSPAAMERFIKQVRSIAPDAIGAPVSEMEAGKTVVNAFRQAFISSFIAITLLLLILLRSVVDTLLVLVPLVLAGLLTMAGMVLLGVSFNFANVIALPLILGVGVDYGVYIVQRGRQANANVNILQTSTARAVLFGALITMANFGNLMLAKHPGTVSMGLLLTVGLGMTLLCALVLLPSLLARRQRKG
ncbi:MAG: MMPL family transporter [Stenotrophobium sp.]